MSKLRQPRRPLSFRRRMLSTLLISALIASVISLVFSFLISQRDVKRELEEDERNAALTILTLAHSTDLPVEELIHVGAADTLVIRSVEEVSEEIGKRLNAEPFIQLGTGRYQLPNTWLKVEDIYIEISPSGQFNLFLVAFLRIFFAATSFFAVFLLMSTLASWRMSRPITRLTRATRQIASGNYEIQLPESGSDDINQLTKGFNQMAEALAHTSWMQKDFISSISHEFRTPIASIKGFARLLQMPGLTKEQQQEYVDLIAQESDRLSRLSDTLLRLSALEQQTSPATLSTFRMDEQVRQVILRLEPAWSARDIDWQLDLQPVTITSDNELLTQVWVNLIHNAVKFSDVGSQIDITVQEGQNSPEFIITDHGIGMEAETASRIFERFYQADRSRKRDGVGLGLSLVQRILIILGGTITVESKLGEGSTFTVCIPREPSAK